MQMLVALNFAGSQANPETMVARTDQASAIEGYHNLVNAEAIVPRRGRAEERRPMRFEQEIIDRAMQMIDTRQSDGRPKDER